MPYTKRKQKCKQSDGDAGNYVLSYTDKKGKKRRACHTSKKKMQGQIAAIEGPYEDDTHPGPDLNEDDKKMIRITMSQLRRMIQDFQMNEFMMQYVVNDITWHQHEVAI